ncbi:MAG: hypothetical protein WCE75_10990 [Terracidiphilus sp.]
MGSTALSLRFPLILLAIVDIYLLAQRLSPLSEVFNLPLNGAVGIDPAVCLAAYIFFLLWLPRKQQAPMKKALGIALLFGLAGGALIVAELQLKATAASQDTPPPVLITRGLLIAAAVLWGVAGTRGGKLTGNAGVGLLAGLWAAMVSSLMAATAILARMSMAGTPAQVSSDPWKQYQGLAIGNAATQALVVSLNSATFYLLVGPLAGAVLGLFFALFSQSEKA